VDENVADGLFKSQKRAEYLERCIYVCPFCGLSEFESHGNEATCKKCGRTVTYGEDKRISGAGFKFPFEFFGQWYDYQNRFVNDLDTTELTVEPLFRDRAVFSEVIVYKKKFRSGKTALSACTETELYWTKAVGMKWCFPLPKSPQQPAWGVTS
jgi:hypothetical protein